jgi:hypothetical protein
MSFASESAARSSKLRAFCCRATVIAVSVLDRRRIRRIALEQNLAAERPASRGAT